MITRWKMVLLAVTIANIINYFQIREILWSIVWLNKGGKHHEFIKFKKAVRGNESFFSQVSMRYLLEYISKHPKDFIVWRKAKCIFACVESIMEISYYTLGLVWSHESLFNYFSLFMFTQAMFTFIFLRIQFGINGHLTKYDRMRMKK